MKKIIIIILVFFAGKAIGQPIGYQPMNGGYQYKYLKVDSGFNIPNHDTVLWRGINRQGAMVYKPNVGGGLFVYNGVSWDLVGGDLTPLWNAINEKVDSVTVTGDSLFYWVGGISYGYLFPNNNAIGLQTVITQGDSLSQNNVIDGGQFNLNWDSLGQYTLTTYRANGTVSQYYQDSNMVRLQSRASIYRLENDTTTIESGKAINIQTPDNSLKISDDSTVFETTGTNVFKVKGLPSGAPLYAIGADATGKFYLVDTAGGSGGGSSWSLTGNAGTTSANFIGTTDRDTLEFRVGNVRFGYLNKAKANVSFGENSLYNNTTGYENVSIGYQALLANTSGSDNTAIGINSLYSNTSGIYNNSVGASNLGANTTGSFNNSLGNSCLNQNLIGNHNIAIGSEAAVGVFGNSNIALGHFSLMGIDYGNHNIGIGDSSLGGISNGIYNIGIGYGTRSDSNYLFNATAIGWRTTVNQSNSIVLGSINGVNGATTSTNVGIGTTTPTHLLHISAADSNVLRLQGLIEGLATDSMLTIDSDGRVHKRVIPTGGGSSIQPFQTIVDTDTTLGNTQASYLFKDITVSRTITLPATPTDGLEIQITSYYTNSESSSGNILTIIQNAGQDIEGGTGGYIIEPKGTIKLKYYDIGSSWAIITEKL